MAVESTRNISSGQPTLPLGYGTLAGLMSAVGTMSLTGSAVASPIVPTADTTNTLINTTGDRTEISGGSQVSDNLFHNFDTFSVDTHHTADFVVPETVQSVIGQISGGQPSEIHGTLQVSDSSADLFLFNPAGVLFGPDAQLNLGGSLTATTADAVGFGDAWLDVFSTTGYEQFEQAPSAYAFSAEQPAAVINQAALTVPTQESIQLIGGRVVNTGELNAPAGNVTLTAVPSESLVRLNADGALLNLEVSSAALSAHGGKNPGEENSSAAAISPITTTDLPALLTGNSSPEVTHLQQNPNGSVVLNAGAIDVSGTSPGQQGGSINLLGSTIDIQSSQLEASGDAGGGFIRIGGDYRGQGMLPTADTVIFSEDSVARADAIASGEGGQVIVWSEDTTQFSGLISAQGIDSGGLVETSGRSHLGLGEHARVIATSTSGPSGTWLLDPANLSVVNSGGSAAIVGGTNTPATSTQLNASTLVSALNGTNVQLQATNSISVEAQVNAQGNGLAGNLQLDAPTVNLNEPVLLRAGSVLSGTPTTVNLGANGILQNAVDAIAAGGTVNLAAVTYSGGETFINKDVTLQGQGANTTQLDGLATHRLLNISGGNITVDNIGIINGRGGSGGGILVNAPGSLTFTNGLVSDNRAETGARLGGGIHFVGAANSAISDSVFLNNYAGVFGGGVRIGSDHRLTIDRTLFQNNSAAQNGGAIDRDFTGGGVLLRDSTLDGNTVGQDGGAIAMGNGTGANSFDIERTTFTNNTANRFGGAIEALLSDVNITDSTFLSNRVIGGGSQGGAIAITGNLTISGTRVEGNRADGNGGAILLGTTATGMFSSSTFDSNESISGQGGALYLSGTGTSQITETTLSNNQSNLEGGAIVVADPHTLEITRSLLNDNIAGDDGGAIFHASTGANALRITTSTLSNNQANTPAAAGGAVSLAASTSSIFQGVTIADNQTSTAGGGIKVNATAVLSLANSIVAGNTAVTNNDIDGNITSGGRNLVASRGTSGGYIASDLPDGTNPLLLPLADYGGATFTHALSGTSPALNQINTTDADQRGAAVNGLRDIGAYELLTPSALSFITGDGQTTTVNTAFPTTISVRATDAIGGSLSGIPVTFSQGLSTAGVVFDTPMSTTTGANGLASLSVSANTTAGSVQINATTPGTLSPFITVTNTPDVPNSLAVIGGDNQSAEINTAFNVPLAVRVRDQFGNAIAGEPVTFAAPIVGPSASPANAVVNTNALGESTAALTANSLSGNYVISATNAGRTFFFQLTNTASAPDPVVNLPTATPTSLSENPLSPALDPTTVEPMANNAFGRQDPEEENDGSRRIGLFDDIAFSQLERSLTDEYAQHWQQPVNSSTTLDTLQQILRQAEDTYQTRSAVVYGVFVPTYERDNLANTRYPSVLSQRLLQSGADNEQDQLLLIMVPPEGEPIQQLVDVTRRQVTRQAQLLGIELSSFITDGYIPLSQQLYGWLMAPVEPDLARANVDNVIYVLDRGLRSLPLSAMMNGEQFVVERYGISMLPSASLLQTDFDAQPAEQTVLLGGADTFETLASLPSVPVELDLIEETAVSSQILFNEQFQISSLAASQANRPKEILHLATHAEFNPGAIDRSYIQFWEEQLTLDGISSLALEDLELLVLSACTTALGSHEAELGFAGLAAFTGTESAVGSLWNVSDIGTMALMADFYEQLEHNPLRAFALRQAQLSLLQGHTRIENNRLITSTGNHPVPEALVEGLSEDSDALETISFEHPFFWSGFTLVGSPWW